MRIEVGEAPVPLAVLRKAWLDQVTVVLSGGARRRIAAAADTIEDSDRGRPAHLWGQHRLRASRPCPHRRRTNSRELQENIVRSHAAGVGEDLGDGVVRLVILTKLMALARGYSGVRMEIVEALGALLEHGIYPRIPSKGSAGASGDLAPLAHLAGVLIGEGEARIGKESLPGGEFLPGREFVPGGEALRRAGVEPMRLAPKEGLALLNGTQVSTALALAAVFRTDNVLAAALVAGAMSTDAVKGSDVPFDRRIQEVRGHRGQIAVAAVLRTLMQGSEIRASHLTCDRVQDPYSIRCQPQVMGACLDLRQPCLGATRDRGECSDRQPSDLSRNRAKSFPEATSTPNPSPSRQTCWLWPSPRSDRSPSGAPRCSWTRTSAASRPSWSTTAD